MKQIITIQHTQSIHHTNGMVGSWTDWDLSELGIEQAERIGQKLAKQLSGHKIVMYASDLLRAKHTAEIVAKHMEITPIYEDNVAGTLDDEKFAMMSKNYTQEQKDLKAEVRSLQQEIEEQERQADNLEQFIQRVKRNSDLTELTPYALRELVKGIYVEAPDKSSGKRKQKIHISYDLIGFIPVDVLLKAEQV